MIARTLWDKQIFSLNNMLPEIEEIAENLTKEQQLPREYQEYLERIEQDYLSVCTTFVIFRDLLLTATANSANISMAFLCLSIGLGVVSSGLAGFFLGSIPAIIDIKNAEIDLSSDYKVRDISKLLFGCTKLIASGGVVFNATREYRQMTEFAKLGFKKFEVEVKNYEIKVQPNGSLFIGLQLQVVLGTSCLLALLPIIFRILFRR